MIKAAYNSKQNAPIVPITAYERTAQVHSFNAILSKLANRVLVLQRRCHFYRPSSFTLAHIKAEVSKTYLLYSVSREKKTILLFSLLFYFSFTIPCTKWTRTKTTLLYPLNFFVTLFFSTRQITARYIQVKINYAHHIIQNCPSFLTCRYHFSCM